MSIGQGSKIGDDYELLWTPDVGSYVLTAVATDNLGLTQESAPVNVVVTLPNQAPTITITSPTDNSEFIEGASIAITANASDGDGFVSQVEFFVDGESIAVVPTEASEMYEQQWTPVAGSYVLTAIAIDNLALIQTATAVNVNVLVPLPNQPPSIAINGPSDNSVAQEGELITITANASDEDGTVTQVEFFVDGVSIATKATEISGDYSIQWVATSGIHDIMATATDDESAASDVIQIDVNVQPVTIMSEPLAGVYYVGDSIDLRALASDTDGLITQVEFFVDGESVGVETTPSSPGVYELSLSATEAGSPLSITSQSKDDAGGTSALAEVDIMVVATGIGAYIESGGNVMLEAEKHMKKIARSGVEWVESTSLAGYLGTGYMESNTNSGENFNSSPESSSPEMMYEVDFSQPGTYDVWVRTATDSRSDNSLHLGLNGTLIDTINLNSSGSWKWTNATPIVVNSAGVHQINVWMREDGCRVDRIFLTANGITPVDTIPESSAPAASHPLHNDDTDDFINYLEFYLGMDTTTDQFELPIDGGIGGANTVTYQRAENLDPALGTLTAEWLWSEDLVNWHASGTLDTGGNPVIITETVTSASMADPETLEVTVSSFGSRVFLELHVTRTP